MDIIENIKDTITKTGKSAVKKTKDLAGIAKLAAEIEDTKSLLKDVYTEIGKKYCDAFEKGTVSPDFSVDVATVQNLKERLEVIRAERLALSGKVKCEQCGKGAKSDFEFCPYCGTKLPEAAAASEAADAEEFDVADEDEEIDE